MTHFSPSIDKAKDKSYVCIVTCNIQFFMAFFQVSNLIFTLFGVGWIVLIYPYRYFTKSPSYICTLSLSSYEIDAFVDCECFL